MKRINTHEKEDILILEDIIFDEFNEDIKILVGVIKILELPVNKFKKSYKK